MTRTPGKAVKLRRFLIELKELTDKHGMEIGGCGECGSPWIRQTGKAHKNDPDVLEHLYHCLKCNTYGPAKEHQDCGG